MDDGRDLCHGGLFEAHIKNGQHCAYLQEKNSCLIMSWIHTRVTRPEVLPSKRPTLRHRCSPLSTTKQIPVAFRASVSNGMQLIPPLNQAPF